MKSFNRTMTVLLLSWSVSLVGCGGENLQLNSAGGKVTYKGQPVKNATVMFQPEKGPPATGTTDDSGTFKLATGGRPGAVTGKFSVSVTAVSGGAGAAMSPEDYAKTGDAPKVEQKSLIPEKYGAFATSGLSATVTEASEKNQFEFALTD